MNFNPLVHQLFEITSIGSCRMQCDSVVLSSIGSYLQWIEKGELSSFHKGFSTSYIIHVSDFAAVGVQSTTPRAALNITSTMYFTYFAGGKGHGVEVRSHQAVSGLHQGRQRSLRAIQSGAYMVWLHWVHAGHLHLLRLQRSQCHTTQEERARKAEGQDEVCQSVLCGGSGVHPTGAKTSKQWKLNAVVIQRPPWLVGML